MHCCCNWELRPFWLQPTWLYGRVSQQYACSSWPRSCSERMTPRAVPYAAVARLPVLQCVSTRRRLSLARPRACAAASSAAAPCAPMACWAVGAGGTGEDAALLRPHGACSH